MKPTAGIIGIGHYLPEKIITNEDLVAQGLDTSDDWIQSRTGIRERRIISEEENTSTLALEAARKAIQSAGIDTSTIGLVVVATSTSDYGGFPSVACQVQHALGLPNIPAFDISAACTGFNYALTTAQQYIENNMVKTALVIGADALSKIMDWTDRNTCILFGDGAGAVVLSQTEKSKGIHYAELFSDGSQAEILKIDNERIEMEGRAVFKVAVKNVVPSISEAILKAGLKNEDIDFLIPHQANIRIIKQMSDRLGLSDDKVVTNLEKYGNTSAASIPIALSEAFEKKRISSGDTLVLVGFGAGFTWGINILEWEL